MERKLTAEDKKHFARSMRNNPTAAERLLWLNLRRDMAGNRTWPRWHRQKVMRGFILDFWCPRALLCVEVDGVDHSGPGQRKWDLMRTKALGRAGVLVLRCSNASVLASPEAVGKYVRRLARRRLETLCRKPLRASR